MTRTPFTIKKRSTTVNVNQLLEVRKQFRVLQRSILYHWDIVSDRYGSKYSQGTTRPLRRDDIVTFAGLEDGLPLFRTQEGYLGIFKPTNSGLVPPKYLEPFNEVRDASQEQSQAQPSNQASASAHP